MSIVRLTWALITAAYACTMLLCLVVTARAMQGELASQLAMEAQPVAEATVNTLASQVPLATPQALASWVPLLEQQARQAGWADAALQDDQGRRLGGYARTGASDWASVLHGGWRTAASQVQVTGADGRRLGMLTLTLSTDGAAHSVGRACLALLVAFAAMGALLLAALHRVERWARRPLAAFQDQIAGLGERRFVNLPQPDIAEWVELSKALNVMVARVRQMLDDRDEAVGSLTDKLAHDALTLTTSRDTFMAALKSHLRDNPDGGGLAILRVDDLEGMNRRLGRNRTDEFLVALATTLRSRIQVMGDGDDFMLARLNGADFGLLLPGCGLPGWQARLDSLCSALAALVDDGLVESAQFAWVGGTTFLRGESVADVLMRTDTMLMAAESRQQMLCTIGPVPSQQVKPVAQWRVVIETALDTGHIRLDTFPVVDAHGGLLHREAMLRLLDASGAALAADDFVAPAIRCGRIADLDLKAIGLALTELGRSTAASLAVNVAAQSAIRPIFQRQLAVLLAGQPALTPRLTLEVRESLCAATTTRAVQQLWRTVAPTGCRVGIDHFGNNLSALSLLSSPGVAYVKLARRVVDAAAHDDRTRAFIGLLVELGGRTGVQVLAGDVATGEAARALAALGVQGFTGPGVELGRPVGRPAVADTGAALV